MRTAVVLAMCLWTLAACQDTKEKTVAEEIAKETSNELAEKAVGHTSQESSKPMAKTEEAHATLPKLIYYRISEA